MLITPQPPLRVVICSFCLSCLMKLVTSPAESLKSFIYRRSRARRIGLKSSHRFIHLRASDFDRASFAAPFHADWGGLA